MFLALLFLSLFRNVFGAEVEISSVDQFNIFVNDVNSGTNYSGTTVFLESDLSLSEETLDPIGKDKSNYFSGVFDGQGHIISNLKMSSSSLNYTGLFGYSTGLTIRNVVLDSSCSITNSYIGSSHIYIGGIIGRCYATSEQYHIENNVNMADVTFNGNINSNYYLYLGGIVGDLYSYSYNVYVKNCANYGSVTQSGTTSYYSYIGGIAGYLYGSSSYYKYIYNCLNYGTITHSGTTSNVLYLGGIAGRSYYAYIENCVSAGKMSSTKTSYIGGIVGYVDSYTYINYCYYANAIGVGKLYGAGTPASSSYTLSYDNSAFELSDAVTVGNHTETSLIGALNAAADYYTLRDYSKWLLNKETKKVTFTINGRTSPITMDYQIILLPSLADEGSLFFYGWYNDSECANLLDLFKITENKILYGKFEKNTNNYTITFDTRGGSSIPQKTFRYLSAVSLPNDLTKDYCSIAFWETAYGDNVGFSLTMPAHNFTLYAVWKCTRIATPEDFVDLSKVVNNGTNYSGTTVFLDSDLSLPVITEPIGKVYSSYFSGIFDGQGHIISELEMNYSSKYAGLFGYSRGLTIKNVVLDRSCSIESSFSGPDAHVGGIIGHCSGQCNIENSVNMADVTSNGNFIILYIGGIAGGLYSYYSSYVKNCANYGSVTQSGTSEDSYIGGIVGYLSGSTYKYIYNCINYGTITHSGISSLNLSIGGIAGYSKYTYIENCVSAGEISAQNTPSDSYIGGIVGYVRSYTYINYCYYTIDVEVNKIYGGNYSAPIITETPSSPYDVSSTLIESLNEYASNKGWNKWLLNINNVTVTILTNDNDGVSLSSQLIVLPDPSLTGSHSFDGWYADSYYATPFQSDEVTDDTTLYGLYGFITTVFFDATGGGESAPASKSVVYGSTYGELPEPNRTGYTFAGWFTETSGGDKIEPTAKVAITNARTLYAHWDLIQYTISFDSNGGSACGNITQDFGTLLVLPEPEMAGYTFLGWFDSDLVTEYTAETVQAGNVTLYAKWAPNIYSVIFNVSGGALLPGEEATKTVIFDEIYAKLPEPNRTGYTFAGWFTYGGTKVESYTTMTTAENHVLYANWTANEYVVVFDASGGNSLSVDGLTKEVRFAEKYGDLPEPNRTGYSFAGWFDEDNKPITNETTVNTPKHHILYARWIANNYTVAFNISGGTLLSNEEAAKTVTFDEEYGDLPEPNRTGYAFLGWLDENDKIVTNETIVITPKNHTLYVHWDPIQYTISFDSNGGSACRNITQDFGTLLVLPEPEMAGYTFTGWVPELSTVPAEDVTLCAQWTANNYTVTFDASGGPSLPDSEATKTVTFDSTYGELPEPERTGHTFAGWADSPLNGHEVSSATTVHIPSNHTLYALWTANQYTITFDFGNGKVTPTSQSYGDAIIYPSEVPSKSFHKFRGWCAKDGDAVVANSDGCNVTHVPAGDLTLTASFDVDPNIVADFSVAIVAVVLVVFLLVVVLVLVIKMYWKKHQSDTAEIELDEKRGTNNEKMADRVFQQVEATKVDNDFIKNLKKLLKKADKDKGLDEILSDFRIEYKDSGDVIESFRTIGAVQNAIVGAVYNNKKKVGAVAAEYISLLYTTVREQEEYEEFDELYFGMKDISNFVSKVDEETISFGGVVSGFTNKKKAIQFLMPRSSRKRKRDGMPSGVLFKVSNGKGYKIGKVDKEIDEVLFEINSVFKVESMKEVTKDKFVVVDLSFVSPVSDNEFVKV